MNKIPALNEIFPNEYKTSCFIKNVITAPNIIVGDYTYYDDALPQLNSRKIMFYLIIRNLVIS